jgi:hypothetical protein
MGLGKTLSILALICSSLDGLSRKVTPPEGDRPRGTLIVSPMSSKPL